LNTRPHVIGLDAGTTGITALAVAHDGERLGRASREFPQHFPQPGWVEHDADEIWAATCGVLADLYATTGLDAGATAALGITNQRETVVAWSPETGFPAAPAIVWQDRRTTSLYEGWRAAGVEPEIRRRTGLVLDPYFSAGKLRWWLDQGMDARRLVCGTVDTWLVWKLSGGAVHATDCTNASRTLLFDIHAQRWDDTLLGIFGVPRAWLPEVRASCGDFGRVRGVPPLRDGLPITGVAGDQQAALFGQRCVAAGDWKNTYGTGCFLMLHTGDRALESHHGLLTTLACGPRGEPAYALEGSVFTAGAAVQWLRDGLGIVADAADCERRARSVPDSHGVVLVPAFTGLGAPHWRPAARAAVFGLTRGATAAHLCRAALDAMAYQTWDVCTAMQSDGRAAGLAVDFGPLRVDGGASRNDLLMQFQADLLGLVVDRPVEIETTALGAAGLAGLGCGLWSDPTALAVTRTSARTFSPQLDAAARDAVLAPWRDAVRRLVDA
jgi:glycerol kinase